MPSTYVSIQRALVGRGIRALFALVRPVTCVDAQVLHKVGVTRRDIQAHAASVLPLSRMARHVAHPGVPVSRLVRAQLTRVRFLASMRPDVAPQGGHLREPHRTDRAFKVLFAGVGPHVDLEAARRVCGVRAKVAAQQLPSSSSTRNDDAPFHCAIRCSATLVRRPPRVEVPLVLAW